MLLLLLFLLLLLLICNLNIGSIQIIRNTLRGGRFDNVSREVFSFWNSDFKAFEVISYV